MPMSKWNITINDLLFDRPLPRKSQSQDYVNTEVVGQQWYRGPMKRWDAEELLRSTPDGTFLVRFSATQQKYVISIR